MAVDVDKLRKLVERLEAVHADERLLLDEIGAVLSGTPGIGAQVKAAASTFSELWAARYRSPYTVDKKYWVQITKQVKALGLTEFQSRARRYLQSSDPFVAGNARHGLGLFLSTIHQYVAAADAVEDLELDADAVADCRHVPQCRTDVEHTRKRQAELRG